MVIHDRHARVTTFNRAGEQASGYTREELRALDPACAFSAGYLDQVRRMIVEGVDAPARTFRAEVVTRDNQRLPIEAQARVLAAGGQVTGVAVVARNLAEREQLEAQLRQAQEMLTFSRRHTAQLGQVVMDLAIARDAMPDGAALTVETGNVEIGIDDLEAIPGPVAPARDTGVVLLAEDDRAVRRLFGAELRRRGYTVLEARHGGEALEICKQYGGDIDVLVTDVVMPQMNGADLAAAIAHIRPEMAVLFISGHPERAGVGLDMASPYAANLLLKPFTPETLSARVHEILMAARS